MTHKQAISSFFSNYCRFLNIDLSVSLLDKGNKYYGRNIDLIIIFQDTLFFLLKNKDEESPAFAIKRKGLINTLSSTTTQYTTEHKAEIKSINCEAIYKTFSENDFFIDQLQISSFEEYFYVYYISHRDFFQYIEKINIREDIKEKFECKKNNDTILVQAILEINNALSHILIAIKNDDNDKLNNINKAINHTYRASLDHYKMLIRLLYTQKNYSIQPNITKRFKELRFKEFDLTGESIDKKVFFHHDEEKSILEHYKETFNEMMMNQSQ